VGSDAPAARGRRLADHTTSSLAALRARGGPLVALLPVGSVEPHGPHLPLATDTLISEAAAARAAQRLAARGVEALVAPALPYGVTDFAEGFAGAVSLPAAALTAAIRAVIEALLRAGFDHVTVVNNHLEPAHDAAVRAAVADLPPARAAVACPLTRRWARTLSAEFRSGACHAGRYETSLVLAAEPSLVDVEAAGRLPDVDVSLSDGIRAGRTTFRAMGLDAAYAGSPARATAAEGDEQLDLLAAMIEAEVTGALAGAVRDAR
jgi:creatinine amidohydrolase